MTTRAATGRKQNNEKHLIQHHGHLNPPGQRTGYARPAAMAHLGHLGGGHGLNPLRQTDCHTLRQTLCHVLAKGALLAVALAATVAVSLAVSSAVLHLVSHAFAFFLHIGIDVHNVNETERGFLHGGRGYMADGAQKRPDLDWGPASKVAYYEVLFQVFYLVGS